MFAKFFQIKRAKAKGEFVTIKSNNHPREQKNDKTSKNNY